MPEPTSGREGSGARRAYREPAAHETEANSTAATPAGSKCAPRTNQQHDAAEADQDADDLAPRRPLAQQQPRDDRHPQRHGGDEQGRDAGRHRLLGPDDHAVPSEQEGSPDDGRREPVTPGGTIADPVPPAHRPGVEDRAGDQEPHGRRQEGGDGLHRDPDREVRGPPHDVHGNQRGPDPPGRRGTPSVYGILGGREQRAWTSHEDYDRKRIGERQGFLAGVSRLEA